MSESHPPTDPWAPGVRAGDVPIDSSSDGILFNDAPAGFKAGDLVTVEVNGVLTFPAPVRIRGLCQHDDKTWWAFVEGSASAVRAECLTPAVAPERGAAPEPPGTLIPDSRALMQFVDAMFRNARRDGWVSLRVFKDNGRSEKAVHIQSVRLNDQDFVHLMLITAQQAANWPEPAVFAPPVCTFKDYRNAKTDNLREGVSLSAECDQSPGAARVTLEALLGPATTVVESGGEWMNLQTGEIENKIHLHWRLENPAATLEELAMLYEARSLAATLAGADRTNISIVHPIRWPGSFHCKKTQKLARIAALNAGTEIVLEDALNILRKAVGVTTPVRPHVSGNGQHLAADHSAVAQALAVIPNDSQLKDEKGIFVHDWNYWNTVGMTIWRSTDGSEEGRLAFHAWSAKARKYDQAETEKRWQHYFRSPPARLGFGSLVYRAREADPEWRYENPASTALTESVGKFVAQLLAEGEEDGDGDGDGDAGDIEPVDLWARFDPPPLPRGVLPKVIEEFALERGRTMGCDAAGIAAGALAVCAGAIPDGIRLQPKKNDTEWQESARIWTVLVGDPSTMKTPSISAATKPLRCIDNELARDYQDALNDWLNLPKDDQKTAPKPKKLRAMIMDTTIESAQEILKDSPNGVLLEDDELSGWFDAMYKYTGARGAQKDRSFWLQAYNGGPKTVDRIVRGTVHIPNLSISIIGGTQPGPLRKLSNSGEDDGLLQRFIPIMLCPAVGGRDEAPGQVVFDYADLIKNLRKVEPPKTALIFPAAASLKLDAGALNIREKLEKKHLSFMKLEGLNRKLTSHFGKYNGLFARLCLVWHCIEHAGASVLPVVVTETTARRVADFLHGFLLKHAVAFYVGVLGLSNDHDRLANVADYILAHKLKRVTNRDVQRGDRSMRRLEDFETRAIFEQLEALGWVMRAPGPRRTDPPHWVVNPVVHQRFAERAIEAASRRKQDREMIDAIVGGGEV